MRTNQITPKNIDEYVAGFPDDVQEILEKIRRTIRKAAPDAEETISYQMPTFTLNGNYLIYFAAYKKHIGLYPAPIEREEEIGCSGYLFLHPFALEKPRFFTVRCRNRPALSVINADEARCPSTTYKGDFG